MLDVESALSGKVALSDDEKSLAPQVDIQSALESSSTDLRRPTTIIAQMGYDLGKVDYHLSEPVPVEQQKQNHINFISNATGFSKEDVEKYYEPIKTVLNVSSLGAVSGYEKLASVMPMPSAETTKGVVDATMTPAIIAAAIADPLLTVARLVAFSALDHVIPQMQVKNATKDEQATVDLVRMLGIGATTGALEAKARSVVDMDTVFNLDKVNYSNLIETYTHEKIKENELPDVITLSQDAVTNIAEIDAQNKIQRKNDTRRQVIVEDLKRKIMENEDMPKNVAEQIIYDAKQQVLDDINEKQANGEKLKNREKQVRSKLQQELQQQPDPNSILGALGVTEQASEIASTNNVGLQVKAEKLVKVAMDSQDNFDKVSALLVPEKVNSNGASIASTESQSGSIDPILGTGESKPAGLALGVEAKAIENRLTKGFGTLPEYKTIKMDEQADLAQKLLKKDPEKARQIAMGQAKAPEGMIPEAMFVAVENKAILEGDANTLRDLATGSKLTQEATTMGQRIRTLAERDPESPVAAIKEVMRTREEAAQKKLGKEPIEKAKAKIVKDIKSELRKPRITKENWADFLKEIEC